jgi:hypothetical protein
MKLTYVQIVTLVGSRAIGAPGALNELHGRQRVITNKDGEALAGKDGQPVRDTVPYRFAPNTRSRLATVAAILRPHAEAYEAERSGIVASYLGKAVEAWEAKPEESRGAKPEAVRQGDADFPALLAEATKLGEQEVEVELIPAVSETDLKVDDNLLPVELLLALRPILKPGAP